jgi:hypothetical protein
MKLDGLRIENPFLQWTDQPQPKAQQVLELATPYCTGPQPGISSAGLAIRFSVLIIGFLLLFPAIIG